MIRRFLARWFDKGTGARSPARPRVTLQTSDAPVYAIGDVHGCLDLLKQAESRIIADAGGHLKPTIVMLGDYVDRGPASAAVIDHLIADPTPNFRRICLAGNHDDAMLRFITDPTVPLDWLDFGGDATLRSYGLDARQLVRQAGGAGLVSIITEAIPPRHIAFLATLPVVATFEDFVFVHAGLRPGISLAEQIDEDLMWIREPFLSEGPGAAFTVVHGHTPSEKPVFGRDASASTQVPTLPAICQC